MNHTCMTCCRERSQERQCCWNRSLELSLTSMESRQSPSNLHMHTQILSWHLHPPVLSHSLELPSRKRAIQYNTIDLCYLALFCHIFLVWKLDQYLSFQCSEIKIKINWRTKDIWWMTYLCHHFLSPPSSVVINMKGQGQLGMYKKWLAYQAILKRKCF